MPLIVSRIGGVEMQINAYSESGRTMAVKFTCRRCQKVAYRTLKECIGSEFNRLADLSPPEGWEDGGFYYPLFCPECSVAHNKFMNMED